MIFLSERKRAWSRLRSLETRKYIAPRPQKPRALSTQPLPEHSLALGLCYAGIKLHPLVFLSLALGSASLTLFLSLFLCSPASSPLFGLIGLWLPFAWLDRRAEERALAFAEDYPAILLATASSIKVGLPPETALLRATKLLPKESVARTEVEILLRHLRDGRPKEQAIQAFAADYRLPDLDLFRSAFLLVMETGGRFSPTLQRLAAVSTNRMTLLKMAGVSTASMRMTGNVLLAIAPVLLFVLSSRIQDFWGLLRFHPTANFAASVGILMMTLGYLSLRKMSRFKP